jgi:hypothetical protein|tara:strand:- start:400 stop:525 length:126 start_codon:yes stop_codon:yes gene_type:complete
MQKTIRTRRSSRVENGATNHNPNTYLALVAEAMVMEADMLT